MYLWYWNSRNQHLLTLYRSVIVITVLVYDPLTISSSKKHFPRLSRNFKIPRKSWRNVCLLLYGSDICSRLKSSTNLWCTTRIERLKQKYLNNEEQFKDIVIYLSHLYALSSLNISGLTYFFKASSTEGSAEN